MVSLSNDGVSHLSGKRRKVSAIRLFPPHCGRNAPPESVEDVLVNANIEFSQASESGCSASPVNPIPKEDVFDYVKQDISESCGENDPWVNQHPKEACLVSVKQELPDDCGENNPPLPKEDCVVSVKREFCDGCGDNDPQIIKHTLNPHLKEDGVVSMKQESPDGYLQNSPGINAKIRKDIVVSAERRFPPGCGRNAPQINAKPNESGVSVEKMRLEVVDTFVGPPIEQTGSSTMEPGGFESSKSSSQIVSLDLPEALMSETASSLEVLDQAEVPEPVNILEPMVVKRKAGDVVSTRRKFHDDVAVENLEAEKNGVPIESPSIQTFGSPVELWTFELTENSGQTGSSKSPKSLISETTNEPEVPDCSEAPAPIELVEPMLVDNHKSLDRAELTNSMTQVELGTTGSMKNFNQTKLFPSIKNPDGLEFRDSQAGEKECSSNLLQLPVDSVLPVMQGQPQVSDQPHASDPVDTARKKMHKKYPPPRRISACRDFPPRCALNSPCSVIEIGSFRDACVDNGKSGVLITSEHSVRDHANQKSEKVEDEDVFGDKTQVNLNGEVEIQMVEHVPVRGKFDSKLKQEDRDAINIQTPCENAISESDLDSLPSERKVDRESRSSGEDVGVESVKFGSGITLKRKLPGMSFDDNCTANHYQVQENVGSEFSSERVVNLALMSAENCPWSIGKRISKPPGVRSHTAEKRKQTKHEEGSLAIVSQSQTQEIVGLELYDIQVTAQAEMASSNCPWDSLDQKLNHPIYLSPLKPESSGKKNDFIVQDMTTSVSGRKKAGVENSKGKHKKKKPSPTRDVPYEAVPVEEDAHTIKEDESPLVQTAHAMDLSLIPFGLHPAADKDNGNEAGITRNRVRETLRLFQGVLRKLMQDAESKSKTVQSNNSGRADLVSARILKENNKWVNIGQAFWGNVPGVEVGDEFHYRVELAIVGLHRPYQSGIDYSKMKGEVVATSIVASGGYADVMDSSDVLIYSGQGGLPINDKKAEDQKLERGNLALKNSIDKEIPVRVIRGYKEMDSRGKMVATYTYDGLYLVEKYWEEKGRYDTNVFKFQLRRIPGQPELAIKEVKKSTRSKVREGLCVNDISQGKEKRPICAINTVDDEKPPPFKYITTMIYPSLYNLTPPDGCNCTNGCSDSDTCSCALRNGGEIPFNYDGAIVEAKPLVYECGPSCKCPPSCHNRVSQRGIKFQLEIFKTEKRGWGVRSLNSIPSGSFICEYTGELLRDKEAEERTSNDEYLFDIGHNYNDPTLWQGIGNLIPIDSKSDTSIETLEGEGFTIDAAYYGSVGRFVNHSCSPNLYAQNVLYDHDDKSMPHIMLFAAENIPPLQELSYHYNYELDQVRDSDGNIKKKSCYCGSHECTGRMY